MVVVLPVGSVGIRQPDWDEFGITGYAKLSFFFQGALKF